MRNCTRRDWLSFGLTSQAIPFVQHKWGRWIHFFGLARRSCFFGGGDGVMDPACTFLFRR